MRGAMAAVVVCWGLMAARPVSAEPAPGPELAHCRKLKPLKEPLNDRAEALPVPKSFEMLVNSGPEQFAVANIYGGSICVDTRPMIETRGFTISTDRRFLEFDWTGYEADGHIVVDRSGSGQVIETGESPVSSPSRRLFAAVQQSEASFGGLEGFAVWRIDVVGVKRMTFQEDIPRLADWRIDGWEKETCIDLSGIPHDRASGSADLAKLRRDRYVAEFTHDGWVLKPRATGCPGKRET